jgi:uncharacterized protein YidB (DUF937 family)
MAGIDDLLGGLLGGGQSGGLGDLVGELTGGGGGEGADLGKLAAGLAPLLTQLLGGGGLGNLLDGFTSKGMGEQARSWVGTGRNEEISGAQVQEVLSGDQIAAVAGQLGISQDQAASVLAKVLPQVVDRVTPDGKLPSADELAARIGP